MVINIEPVCELFSPALCRALLGKLLPRCVRYEVSTILLQYSILVSYYRTFVGFPGTLL
jgi:hypothetical protein